MRSTEESLSGAIAEVESLCELWDSYVDNDQDPPADLVEKRTAAHDNLKAEVDYWINRLEASKAILAAREERAKRMKTALNTARSINRYLNDTIKQKIRANPNVVFRGAIGCLYLHKSPKALKIDFERAEKTVYGVVDKSLLDLEPQLNQFVKAVTHYVIDTDAVKAALDKGDALYWARYEQDAGVRIKG